MAMTPPIMPEGHAVWNNAPISATSAMYTATTPPLASTVMLVVFETLFLAAMVLGALAWK